MNEDEAGAGINYLVPTEAGKKDAVYLNPQHRHGRGAVTLRRLWPPGYTETCRHSLDTSAGDEVAAAELELVDLRRQHQQAQRLRDDWFNPSIAHHN